MPLSLVSPKVGKIQIAEPSPETLPELAEFHHWSLASQSKKVSFGESQHPFGIIHGCGQINTSEVFSIQTQGRTFEVLSPGAHVTDTSLASDWYPTHLPDPKPNLLMALVHSCTRAAICRELLDRETSLPIRDIKERELGGMGWLESQGLSYVALKTQDRIPESDSLHAHSRTFRILSRSDEIRTIVAAGDLLVLEAYYDNKSGRVSWPGYWTSAEKGIEKEALEAVLKWQTPVSIEHAQAQLENLRNVIKGQKALEDVLTLVVGNTQHILSRIQGDKKIFKADYVVLGCSDSRAGSQMISAPEGRVEWIRTAGHALDVTTFQGLRIACNSAVNNIKAGACGEIQHETEEGFSRRAVLYVLGHTQCGAINATLSTLAKKSSDKTSPATPLISALTNRFLGRDYKSLQQDPQQVKAAEINAITTVEDILSSNNPDARIIQKLVNEGKLLVVPAVYYTTSGVVGQLIDSDVFQKQIQISNSAHAAVASNE